jgi:hypothetical protein
MSAQSTVATYKPRALTHQVSGRIAAQKEEMAERAKRNCHQPRVLRRSTFTVGKEMISDRYGVKCIGQYASVVGRVAVEKVANEGAVDEQRVLRESTILPQMVQVSALNVRDRGLAAQRRRAHNGFGAQIGEKLP